MRSKSPRHGCPRRAFLKGAAGTAAAVGLGACGGGGSGSPASPSTPTTPATPTAARAPRARGPNPFVTANGRPILVSVEGRDFPAMLERGLGQPDLSRVEVRELTV